MADRELRKMSRAELIEIIYALQQNEKILRAENENLHTRLEDRLVRMESAGSIAEAALSLNHIFEDAQKAAEEYLASVKENYGKARDSVNMAEIKEIQDEKGSEKVEDEPEQIIKGISEPEEELISAAQAQAEKMIYTARTQSEGILSEAQIQAEKIVSTAEVQSQEIISNARTQEEEIISAARDQAQGDLALAEEAWQKLERKSEAFKDQRRRFLEEATAFLHQYPELAERMEAESKKGETQ